MPGKVKRSLLLDRGSDERRKIRCSQAGRVFKHKFFKLVLSETDSSCEREDDRLCVQTEEKIWRKSASHPSVQHRYAYDLLFFPLLRRSTRNHRANRWFSGKLISFSRSRSIEWIENIFNGFYYTYSYVGAKDWQKSLTRIFYWHFISD